MAKKIAIILFLYSFFLCSNENRQIEPYLLFETPTVTISEENNQRFVESPQLLEKEAIKNRERWKEKTISLGFIFLSFLFLFSLSFAFFIYKNKSKSPLLTKEKIKEILDQKIHILYRKKQSEEKKLLYLDQITRFYLKQILKINAFTLTTSEIEEELSKKTSLGNQDKSQIIHILKTSERLKFAKWKPTHLKVEKEIKNLSSIIARIR